jgi:hypothetical protein
MEQYDEKEGTARGAETVSDPSLAVARLSEMGVSAAAFIVLLAVPLVIVAVMFVWAAGRDGEEDRAVQLRLGIRRKTRLGR